MGRKTSDFVALAAILAGSGFGLGLTSLFARGAPVPDTDDSSVRVQVRRHVVTVDRDHIIVDGSMAPTVYLRRAPFGRLRVNVGELRGVERGLRRLEWQIKGLEGERLERLRSQVEELRLETGKLERSGVKSLLESGEFEALLESLEGLEALEDLNFSQDFTIEVRRDDEDGRRRRRRRPPPHRAVDVPDSDAPRN